MCKETLFAEDRTTYRMLKPSRTQRTSQFSVKERAKIYRSSFDSCLLKQTSAITVSPVRPCSTSVTRSQKIHLIFEMHKFVNAKDEREAASACKYIIKTPTSTCRLLIKIGLYRTPELDIYEN